MKTMVTYRDWYNGKLYQYFYDFNDSIRLWTIYEIDKNGNQISETWYCANKMQLIYNFPAFKFTKQK
jgi:hypothetical protein